MLYTIIDEKAKNEDWKPLAAHTKTTDKKDAKTTDKKDAKTTD